MSTETTTYNGLVIFSPSDTLADGAQLLNDNFITLADFMVSNQLPADSVGYLYCSDEGVLSWEAVSGGGGGSDLPTNGVGVLHNDGSGNLTWVSLATVATSGSYNDLTNKPTIPAAQVNSDWNASSGVAKILNKPTIPSQGLAAVVDDPAPELGGNLNCNGHSIELNSVTSLICATSYNDIVGINSTSEFCGLVGLYASNWLFQEVYSPVDGGLVITAKANGSTAGNLIFKANDTTAIVVTPTQTTVENSLEVIGGLAADLDCNSHNLTTVEVLYCSGINCSDISCTEVYTNFVNCQGTVISSESISTQQNAFVRINGNVTANPATGITPEVCISGNGVGTNQTSIFNFNLEGTGTLTQNIGVIPNTSNFMTLQSVYSDTDSNNAYFTAQIAFTVDGSGNATVLSSVCTAAYNPANAGAGNPIYASSGNPLQLYFTVGTTTANWQTTCTLTTMGLPTSGGGSYFAPSGKFQHNASTSAVGKADINEVWEEQTTTKPQETTIKELWERNK